MAIFTVLEPPDDRIDRVTFEKEGFSWGAFAFTVLWALWHRMWMVAAILFALFVCLSLLASEAGLNPILGSSLQFGLCLVFGFEARALHIASLKRVGFRSAGLIEATTLEAAELEYFARRKSVTTAPGPTAFIPHADDTLGIFGNV